MSRRANDTTVTCLKDMNPDRATLNFLNSFPEKSRDRGHALQDDGAVTQIFGNHLFICSLEIPASSG